VRNVSFRTLVDNEAFINACSENGYSATYDSEMKAVVLEDAVGKHCFKDGIKARDILSVIEQSPSAATLDSLLSPLLQSDGEEIF
jgi:hypothetical protein